MSDPLNSPLSVIKPGILVEILKRGEVVLSEDASLRFEHQVENVALELGQSVDHLSAFINDILVQILWFGSQLCEHLE